MSDRNGWGVLGLILSPIFLLTVAGCGTPPAMPEPTGALSPVNPPVAMPMDDMTQGRSTTKTRTRTHEHDS